MKQETINAIAERYLQLPHDPDSPAWVPFIRETQQQFEGLVRDGWRFLRTLGDPYLTSEEMFRDLKDKRLLVFSGAQNLLPGHPLLGRYYSSPDNWSLGPYNWKLNEVFRAVHDVLGHGPINAPFETLEGELQALQNHAAKYSEDAGPALLGETLGQLCHYYSGRGFVEVQRAIVMPIEELRRIARGKGDTLYL